MPLLFRKIKSPSIKRLRRRERALIALLFLSLMTGLFYRKVYVPRAVLIKGLSEKLDKLHAKKLSTESLFPDLDTEKEKFNQMKKQYEESKNKLRTMESDLWDRARMPELLEVLTAPQEEKEIDLLWVRLKKATAAQGRQSESQQASALGEEGIGKEKKKELYPRVYIEMCFYSSFNDLIEYIGELEVKEGYLKVTDIKMSLSEAKPTTPRMILTLSTLVGEGVYKAEEEKKKEIQDVFGMAEDMIERENIEPFSPDGKPFKKAVVVGLKLSGIIGKGENAGAIINDVIYKVGDKVGDKVLISIDKKEAVLEKEDQRYHLEIIE